MIPGQILIPKSELYPPRGDSMEAKPPSDILRQGIQHTPDLILRFQVTDAGGSMTDGFYRRDIVPGHDLCAV